MRTRGSADERFSPRESRECGTDSLGFETRHNRMNTTTGGAGDRVIRRTLADDTPRNRMVFSARRGTVVFKKT
jgi:hypothetical protein